MPSPINIAVEGYSDGKAVERLIHAAGLAIGETMPPRGKAWLDSKVEGLNRASRHMPWLVLRDMDHDADCPVDLVQRFMADPADLFCLRIAVRSVEAWALAARDQLARFMGISREAIPRNPDTLINPKAELVRLARRSKRRAIREGMAPPVGTNRTEGPTYATDLGEFFSDHWSIDQARGHSESLDRAVRSLERFAETGTFRAP